MPNVAITTALASTTHPITAPASPGFIRVLGFLLVAAGTTNVTLQDTTAAALTGPLPLTATCGEVEAFDEAGVFDLAPGVGLDMVNSAAIQVSGFIKYIVKGN